MGVGKQGQTAAGVVARHTIRDINAAVRSNRESARQALREDRGKYAKVDKLFIF